MAASRQHKQESAEEENITQEKFMALVDLFNEASKPEWEKASVGLFGSRKIPSSIQMLIKLLEDDLYKQLYNEKTNKTISLLFNEAINIFKIAISRHKNKENSAQKNFYENEYKKLETLKNRFESKEKNKSEKSEQKEKEKAEDDEYIFVHTAPPHQPTPVVVPLHLPIAPLPSALKEDPKELIERQWEALLYVRDQVNEQHWNNRDKKPPQAIAMLRILLDPLPPNAPHTKNAPKIDYLESKEEINIDELIQKAKIILKDAKDLNPHHRQRYKDLYHELKATVSNDIPSATNFMRKMLRS